jgi:hypothetical protein
VGALWNQKGVVYLQHTNTQHTMKAQTNTLTEAQAQDFIQAEMKRRTDLVNDAKFREICVKYVKEMGVSAKEWNENKVHFLMMFANEFCRKENEELRNA